MASLLPMLARTPRTTPGGIVGVRAHDWAAVVLACGGATILAVGISAQVPTPGWLASVGLGLGVPAVAYLALSQRYGLTLTLLALYVGLADGYLKLSTGVTEISLVRDVLIAAIAGGALARLLHQRGIPKLPPLTPWVVAFGVIVALQLFNPNTLNTTKALGGLRQHLEWVPLFFFGYLLLRSERSLRNLCILIGIIAAVNGVVGLVQFHLSPDELANWGPGYAERLQGTGPVSSRLYIDEMGNERVRPFGLGSDMGFAGTLGVVAAPLVLALLATGRLTKRWWLGGLMAAGVLAGGLT